jgi:hypothetical protein
LSHLAAKEIRFRKSLCHVLFPRIMRSIIYWFTLAYRKILQQWNCELRQAWTVDRSQQGYRHDFFVNVIDSRPLVIESPSTRGSRAFAAIQPSWPRVVSAVNVYVAVMMLSDHEQMVSWKFKKVAKILGHFFRLFVFKTYRTFEPVRTTRTVELC